MNVFTKLLTLHQSFINGDRMYTKLACSVFLTVLLIFSAFGQSDLKRGNPYGSYKLSGLDNIDYGTGNLTFDLTLGTLKGREEVGYSPNLHIERDWYVPEGSTEPESYDTSPENPPIFSPGMMSIYGEALSSTECDYWDSTRTYFVFVSPEGTRYKFFDTQTDGEHHVWNSTCNSNPLTTYSRGTLFASTESGKAVFISDSAITENIVTGPYSSAGGTGWILFANGTRYRVVDGMVVSTKDRNGNTTTFGYSSGALASVTDSVGRQITFDYGVDNSDSFGVHDEIIYKGVGGTEDRIVKITRRDLNDSGVLRSGFSVETNDDLTGCSGASSVNSAPAQLSLPHEIFLPNGKKYTLEYNQYAELARVELPSGGAFEYDYDGDIGEAGWSACNSWAIHRRLIERRTYDENNNLVATMTISDLPREISPTSTKEAVVDVEVRNASSALLSKSKHYSLTNHQYTSPQTVTANFALNGREFKSEDYDLDGTTVLRKTETPWTSTCTLIPNEGCVLARITEKKTSLWDGSGWIVSKETYDYDGVNNVTDTYHYDFGSGSPGSLLKRAHTTYVTDSNYTSHTGPYLKSLPLEQWVSSDSGGSTKVSLTQYEYDDYSTNSTHAAITSRSSVTGHDSTNYGTGFSYRGNVTAITKYANAGTPSGGVTTYAQYDILGNVVKNIDGNANATTISYADNFGSADSNATSNSTPSQISGYNTFAFATSTTNPLSWTAYTQYDYFTGQVVNTQDSNGLIAKVIHNDDLDRPTQKVSAIGTANEIQTTIEYDETNRRIETSSDLFALNDNLSRVESYYDGLGRTVQERTYRDGTYARTDTQYDGLGRIKKVSNPYRPELSESAVWTETTYDGLDRIVNVETPDGAETRTAYSANRILVVDPAGKKRISKANSLGQLKDVWEVRGTDAATVSVTFPGSLGSGIGYGYQTTYLYDTLGNLTGVDQGSNDRSFAYDHLSRLTSATNPESGTVTFTYDGNGNIKTKRDARNIKTVYDYDELNRIEERCYRSIGGGSLGMTTCVSNSETAEPNTPDVNYTYEDAGVTSLKGVLTEVTNGTSTTENTSFDATGRITGHKQTTDSVQYTTGYTYYLSGAVNETTYPSGRVTKNVLDTFDGTLSQVQSKRSGATFRNFANGFVYNAAGSVTAMRLGNGLWENTVYDEDRLQPTQIGLGIGVNSQSKLKIQYGYGATDNNGNVLSQTITTPGVAHTFNQTYTYDALNRLETAEETYNSTTKWEQEFSYDRYGNRRFVEGNTSTLPKNCGTSPNFTVCTADVPIVNPEITSNNKLTGTTYDASGNVTEDGRGWTYTYNGENKQALVEDDNTDEVGQYAYDGDGRRVKKFNTATGEITVFVYDAGGTLIAEYDTTIQTGSNAKTVYTTVDALGSPRINTDGVGNVIARHDYHPFGEEIATAERTSGVGYTSDTLRKQFTGYERDDETGLDFAQARYFNSGHGRFSSPDPTLLSARAVNPQTWNRYVYVLNNPYLYTDPLGLWELEFQERTKEKKNKDGSVTQVYDRTVVIAKKSKAGDDGASLAKQLGLKGKAAEKFAASVGAGDNIRLAESKNDNVSTLYENVENGLTRQAKYSKEHPDRPLQGPDDVDCSETAVRTAYNATRIPLGVQFNVGVADAVLGSIGVQSVNESELQPADIVRWEKGGEATHFASFIFRNDDGQAVVYSKSGQLGVFEVKTTKEITAKYRLYGEITGMKPGQTGYYRPN